ncbi:MAG: GAF domain-containing protein [Anaerolineae bacterium]|nr:GAF domain-containing protein [Anaerolineae bacterium]
MGIKRTAAGAPRPYRASERTGQRLPAADQASTFTQVALALSVDVANLLSHNLELAPLVQRAAHLIEARLQIPAVGIYRFDPVHNTIETYAQIGAPPPWFRAAAVRLGMRDSPELPTDADPVRTVLHQQQTVRVEATPASDRWLVLPLDTVDDVIGALALAIPQGTAETEEAERALEALARHVAIAIRHAERYDTERRQRQFAEKLNAVGHALSQTLDLGEILRMVLGQLAAIVPHDRSSIMLEEGNEVVNRAARGFPEHANPLQIRVPIREDDVYGTIRTTQKPLVIPDVAKRPDWQYVDDLPRARSWLGVPLVLESEVIGMLSLTRERPEPFTDEEVTLSASFAHEAAMALHNARLYDNLSQVNAVLERAIAELQQRSSELESSNQKLKRLDQAKSDFITVASHELRTPLTVVSGYSQMLVNDGGLKRDDYRWQLVKGIQSGTERLCKIVDNMLDMARIDNRALQLKPEPQFLAVVINSIINSLSDVLENRDIRLKISKSLDKLPMIEADITAIRKVFYHLIVNAIKYTPDGGSVQISGRALKLQEKTSTDGWVEVIISDTGIGIDPSVQELIFAKFYQTGQVASHSSGISKFKGGGPGLGLAITRGIVEAHGGRVWVESPGYDEVHCPGSDFHVLLPLRPDTVMPSDM